MTRHGPKSEVMMGVARREEEDRGEGGREGVGRVRRERLRERATAGRREAGSRVEVDVVMDRDRAINGHFVGQTGRADRQTDRQPLPPLGISR